ncbi:HGGxSTG domain-containing protein [Ruegeria atlantica]|uniref:HGGxSTG domain-containing protein n=1 Tax=Ruegeria atlantica TaxID=81569 RepID=UPI00157FF08F|nr:HGGxSTG domain-containing protein [Ruegeria atlantica]
MTSETKICGARTKYGVCLEPPVEGKTRCRLHGGLSTGAKTAEGRKRISEANTALWAERNRLIELARSLEATAS